MDRLVLWLDGAFDLFGQALAVVAVALCALCAGRAILGLMFGF